ncbi:pyridine nucleotide-disulfide oxidoreductase [Sutcliffiella horikoshii]|uniref:Pyridine nucleotide-disulfide oxidoreductase n=1 Tax=Sutcliffiella horikoshii TaxID=79883 RepID=A0ABM6KPE3_9BACI|nr:NAD(P)/FAD-dependent oxidoreductase [Sutcliffiella horikoshii]ART78358.1 pyridine nucleotide-disulfide oxidoreductase [Sutcliffiella horikoshii]
MVYDCIIVGGGIAGLQAAIQLGRYQHKVLVLDEGKGRSSMCHCYHNLLGWPDGVSGEKLRGLGKEHALRLGVEFKGERVEMVRELDGRFCVTTIKSHEFFGRKLLLATGIKDNIPSFEGLLPCLGKSIFVCPDCDGYEILNKPALVIGSGNAGASMALTLTYWTDELTFINHGKGEIDADLVEKLAGKGITIVSNEISQIHTDCSDFKGVTLANGKGIECSFAFLALGGNRPNTDLALQLRVELEANKHILVDPRTKMTSVENVWAAGDITVHSEQAAIAMGDGIQAAIWIHKSLLES